MKKVILFLSVPSLCALFAIGTNSCGKEGPQGEQGLQGIQGIQGIKGDNGNTIYSGTVAPPANLGDIGDFYLHTSHSNFYGPKTAYGWGTPISLRDVTAATEIVGVHGSKIFSGTAEPATNIGAVADYYMITTR